MLNSKLVNSYYLYVKTNLKSILLVIIYISNFMLHICTLFQNKNLKTNNYIHNMFYLI